MEKFTASENIGKQNEKINSINYDILMKYFQSIRNLEYKKVKRSKDSFTKHHNKKPKQTQFH